MTGSEAQTGRRGVIAIIVAVSVVVLLGFAALVVDVGALFQVEAQLHVACESAALAGASHLDRTEEGLARAEQAALAYGAANSVRGEPVDPAALQLTWGVWNDTTGFQPSGDVEQIDAVRVDAVPHSVSTPFAGAAWSMGLADVVAYAIARRPVEPADEVNCFLPMTIPTCRADAIEAGGHPWVEAFQLANDSQDTIAWAHPDGANAANVVDALEGAAAGQCLSGLAIGDDVPMVNGVEATALHTLEELLRGSGDPWDTDLWGPKPARDADSSLSEAEYAGAGVIQGAMAVFDDGGASCEDVGFSQPRPMESFAWAVIFDVYSGPGMHKGVQVYLDLEHDFETPGQGGGPGGNVNARPPGLLVE